MKKEYLIISAIFLFFLSYLLNFLAGSVSIVISSPLEFFNQGLVTKYPLTTVEIGAKAIGLVLAVIIIVGELEKRPFVKAAIFMVLSMLSSFYAIQQLTTSGNITPIQWTLALAYGGALLVPFIFYYVLRGVIKALFSGLSGKSEQPVDSLEETPTIIKQ